MNGMGWWLAAATVVLAAAAPAARSEPVGPCSPYRAADGDVSSEMPGCSRRARPVPGSLGDELQFRRAHGGPTGADAADDDPEPPRRRRPARPAR